MNHEEFTEAAEYWTRKEALQEKPPREKILKRITGFIKSNNTCALATGTGDFVRCTPIEYSYHEGAFWMFSEGGQKFRALEKNTNVCLAIYEKYKGFGEIEGLQVMGEAEIVEPFSEEYLAEIEWKKIPLKAFEKLPRPMCLIKVTPKHFDFLCSALKEEGLDVRQPLEI